MTTSPDVSALADGIVAAVNNASRRDVQVLTVAAALAGERDRCISYLLRMAGRATRRAAKGGSAAAAHRLIAYELRSAADDIRNGRWREGQ